MKNSLNFALALVLISFAAQSQNSILWEISGNGLSQRSYLMGTLKFIGEKEFYMPANVTTLMRACNSFAIEDEVDHHAQHELNKVLHYPKGQSLATTLSPDDYKKLKDLFRKEFGVDSKAFDHKYSHIKPLAISIIMTRLSLGEKTKFYDIELLRIAKDNNLTAYSLEGIEREAEALNQFPIEEQAKALMHSIANFQSQKDEYQKLMADYPKGNLEEIFQYTLHPTENNPRFLEEFYYKRNEEWLPKIESMMKEGPTFLALGLSHLEGSRGILRLLEQKGYVLTPVKVN
jgi:uncharacterized protein